MPTSGTIALVTASAFSAAAALAHIACVVLGPSAYRFMGAGEKMARAVAAGKLQPTLTTLAISAVLFVWSAYALSGAGLIAHLPFTKPALVAITAVYLGRAVLFPFLRPAFPGNSNTFWLVSSGICLVIGLVHLYGLAARWTAL
ncbi:MAG: hypothetical protein K9J74_12010 [Sulfuritalea sp.]|nr:hypothetical protein [Sulfuritalea sp.]